MGCQSRGSIMARLPGGSPGSALGSKAGVIKPGGVVLVVLVGVVHAWGLSESHLLTGCEEEDIKSTCLSLGVAMASGLLEACYKQQGAEVCPPACLRTRFPASMQGGQ